MNRPRLFLSAVSEELRTARQSVAATVRTLGYDPVSQDDFPTGYGELRQWLREQIDSCEGLIQLVGQGYGAEPPEVDPAYGRVSYTQFEFLYARQQGKKTWLIVVCEGCHRDKPPDKLDLPREAGHPDPAGYQAERRQLQMDYIARLKEDNHLRHKASNDTELQNIVLRLKDELGELRQHEERRQRRLTGAIIAILLGLMILGGGGWWVYRKLHTGMQQSGVVTTEKIRAHLRQTVDETHRRELAQADKVKDWKERQRLREAADQALTARLQRIEDLATSFAEIEGRGTATSVFKEMSRILAEQGVDEAIAYVESQQSDILKKVRARAAMAREKNRADLQPLLKTAGLYQARGQADKARDLYDVVLTIEPNWPEALHAAFWFHIDQGALAMIHTTLAEAQGEYDEAQRLAQRLTASDPNNTLWQHDLSVSYVLLGDVARARGKLKEAAQAYKDSLAIAQKLAAADPNNTRWQHYLGLSYDRVANLAVTRGRLEEAAQAYKVALASSQRLTAADPNNTRWQADLSVSHKKVGDVARARGKLREAARAYKDGLAIAQKLAAADPSNIKWQHGLGSSYDGVGDVARAQGKLEEAAQAYKDALASAQRLTAADPNNTRWQRALLVSYLKVGDVAMAQGKLGEAAQAHKDALAIAQKLAAADPSNTRWQRDLSVSYVRVGDVAGAQGKLEEGAQAYTDALAIRKKLAAVDPSNTEWQRDLWVSYWKLAYLAKQRDNPQEAQGYYKQALKVLESIDRRGLHISPEDRDILEVLRQKVGAASR